MSVIVPASGPTPNPILLIGEAPGKVEAQQLRPFVGPSGRLQDAYLSHYHSSCRSWRKTNVIPLYLDGNPDPTPELISQWTPYLNAELLSCNLSLIICVGRFAMRHFLGESADLEISHGLLHEIFSPVLNRFVYVLPIYHPAGALHADNRSEGAIDRIPLIVQDYGQVARYASAIKSGNESLLLSELRHDPYAGVEDYHDITGSEMAEWLFTFNVEPHWPIIDGRRIPPEIGLDTETTPSIQVSTRPGTGWTLRACQPDFHVGIAALQFCADNGSMFVTHQAGTPSGCMYDTVECRALGLDLSRATIWDTMNAAYLLKTESKALKTLASRFCGMEMEDYSSLVEGIARDKQIAHLRLILSIPDWSIPIPILEQETDGSFAYYTPTAIPKIVAGILRDIDSGKVIKTGPTNPEERYKKIHTLLRDEIESRLGPLPYATLNDIPLSRATFYASRDADATLRLKSRLSAQLALHDIPESLISLRNSILPVFEEIQRTGMPASHSRFLSLQSYVQTQMDFLQHELSTNYNHGRPFNPASQDQVNVLMLKQGLTGEKKSAKTGKQSTGKKSIEHLRHSNHAIDLVMLHREHAKIRDTYVDPILSIWDKRLKSTGDDSDLFTVYTQLQPVTQTAMRLSSRKPAMLNQPSRTELGRRVRSCYVTGLSDDPSSPLYTPIRFGSWDFSGQEARVAAHVSQDETMIRLFREDRDIHTETAMRVFGIPASRVDKWDHRMPCKTAFFGCLNGMSGLGLLDQFRMYIPPDKDPTGHWTNLQNCKNLVNEIVASVYPGLGRAAREIAAHCRLSPDGKISTLYGLPRYLPDIHSREPSKSSAAAREAFNHVIQGTAQGMTQSAQVYLSPTIRNLQDCGISIGVNLQVHDELIFTFDVEHWDLMNDLVLDAMINHYGYKFCIPISAEGHMAISWGELK